MEGQKQHLEGKTPEERLVALGIELPASPKPPAGLYKPVVIVGSLAYVSGQIPVDPATGEIKKGKLGKDIELEEGYQAARICGLSLLLQLRGELGSLNRVKRVVKLLGLVNATETYELHPRVINGCSELLRDVFGEAGVGARSAIGVASLPFNAATEVEGIFEIEP
jgi:enamine deaminase RidA (YjgF/YER057c/UK114 family)